jgi:CDP-diacylglycerol--glycerol-3-phosphate 3-phosphatidyltransferase
MTSRVKSKARELLKPAASFAAELGISPTTITIAGLILSAASGWALAVGRFPTAGVLLVLAGICDMIDGAAARAANRATQFGAFLDSTMDRYSEMVVLLGALVYYLTRSPAAPESLTAVLIFLALGGSFLVSYTRARAEGIGMSCEVGIAERPERLVITIIGALLGPSAFRVAIWILAIVSQITAIQRVRHIVRGTRS